MQDLQQQPDTEWVHLDITVSPTEPPPKPEVAPTIPAKLLAIMRKYKYNWRIEQLSRPRHQRRKFVKRPEGLIGPVKQFPKLSDELKYYSDQVARPRLRDLYINRRLYAKVTKGIAKKFDKSIDKAWDSIYNYYKKKERDRKQRLLLRQKQKDKTKKKELDPKFYEYLAKPKPVFKPEPPKVNPKALTYEPTETIIRLAKIPPRFLNVEPPLEPGKVKRTALKYKASERITAMAQPKKVNEKAKEDEDFDPWAISKNALKYKPTPRILELAKPVERD